MSLARPDAASADAQDGLTVRLDLAYRGTGFRGFAANEGVRTVAGELSAALERILGETPALTVAGRTDAGVHAVGQVVSFRLQSDRWPRDSQLDPSARPGPDSQLARLASSLNRLLQPEIAVTAASFADERFDARRSATSRAYEYRIRNAVHPDPRYGDLEWHIGVPLDVSQMNAAAECFVGQHDFTSFCRRPKGRTGQTGYTEATLIRTVLRAGWSARGVRLTFKIEANAFCHQMVRAIVGHCVAVGRGDRSADDVPSVMAARNRNKAAPIAPAHGLTLVAVRYGDNTQ